MPLADQSARRPRILFVDDETDMLAVFQKLCRDWGYDCLAVPESRQALSSAVGFGPDLIVLDVAMPGMDGFELLRQFRLQPQTLSVPVLMVTGERTDVASRVLGLEGGAWDYLEKPVESAELKARIDRHLANYRQMQGEAAIVLQVGNYLAHSVNNLLSVIQLCAELGLQGADAGSRQKLALLSKSVSKIHDIIENLRQVRSSVLDEPEE